LTKIQVFAAKKYRKMFQPNKAVRRDVFFER